MFICSVSYVRKHADIHLCVCMYVCMYVRAYVCMHVLLHRETLNPKPPSYSSTAHTPGLAMQATVLQFLAAGSP